MSQEEGRSTRRSSTSPRWSWRARGRAAVHRGIGSGFSAPEGSSQPAFAVAAAGTGRFAAVLAWPQG